MSKEDVLLFGSYGMRGTGKSYYEKLKEKDKEIERLNYIIDKQDRDITSLTKSKLILKERHNKAIEYIDKSLSNIMCYERGALINTRKILKGVDKE